jgi:hypothetical protein
MLLAASNPPFARRAVLGCLSEWLVFTSRTAGHSMVGGTDPLFHKLTPAVPDPVRSMHSLLGGGMPTLTGTKAAHICGKRAQSTASSQHTRPPAPSVPAPRESESESESDGPYTWLAAALPRTHITTTTTLPYCSSPSPHRNTTAAMSVKFRRSTNDYELLPRDSLDEEAKEYSGLQAPSSSWWSRVAASLRITDFSNRAVYAHYVTPRRRKRSVLRLIYWIVFSIPYFLILLVLIAGIFFPSYTVRPAHYNELRQRALDSTEPGRANPYGEKVFIAASLYEEKGNLASGAWGKAVLQLIDLLGPENVHLSIYEDNPDLKTKQALAEFREKVPGELCS